MQPISNPPKVGKTALQYGLIFGVIQAVIATIVLLVNDLVFTSSGDIGLKLLLGIVAFLTGLAAYFVAGIFAVKQTGKLSTGTFAGMWAGGIYGVIDCVLSIILFFAVVLPKATSILNSAGAASTTNSQAFQTGLVAGGIGGSIFGVLFAIGVGAGLGVLGGLIGRNISNVRPVPVVPFVPVVPVQPFYPGQAVDPYSGQPMAVNPYAEQPPVNPYSDQPYRGIEQ